MFEQAVLCPAPVRRWAMTLGFTCQMLVIAGALAAPLLWPQLLPRTQILTSIFAPTPPPAELKEAVVPHVIPVRRWHAEGLTWYQPARVPSTVALLDEAPDAPPGVPGGTLNGPVTGLLNAVIAMAAPRRPPEPVPAAAAKPVAPAPPQRIHVTSSLEAARLIHRVDPAYPPLAQVGRISGTVELAGVIGTDGRIRELRATSGHPLLVRAALDAVRQWVYRPTVLGGAAVEVETTITVVFRLN